MCQTTFSKPITLFIHSFTGVIALNIGSKCTVFNIVAVFQTQGSFSYSFRKGHVTRLNPIFRLCSTVSMYIMSSIVSEITKMFLLCHLVPSGRGATSACDHHDFPPTLVYFSHQLGQCLHRQACCFLDFIHPSVCQQYVSLHFVTSFVNRRLPRGRHRFEYNRRHLRTQSGDTWCTLERRNQMSEIWFIISQLFDARSSSGFRWIVAQLSKYSIRYNFSFCNLVRALYSVTCSDHLTFVSHSSSLCMSLGGDIWE